MAPTTGRLPISLVIPAYLAEKHIRNALESVTRGSVVPAEIIVVDDASPDRTGEIAAAAGARVIRFPHNAGPSAARNAGAAVAREPWVAFLDADDIWLDGKLAAQWQALQRWPDAGFSFTDYDVLETNGCILRGETAANPGYRMVAGGERSGASVRFAAGALGRGLVHSMFIRQSSVIVKRELFLRSGGYDPALRVAEDYDFFLRLIGLAPAVAVERALVVYQRQPGSLSADPLDEVTATDRLWSAILECPNRYCASVVENVPQRRPITLRMGCEHALRLGRFAEATPLARKAFALDRSPAALALLVLSAALDNAAARTTFGVAQSLWHARPRQPPFPLQRLENRP